MYGLSEKPERLFLKAVENGHIVEESIIDDSNHFRLIRSDCYLMTIDDGLYLSARLSEGISKRFNYVLMGKVAIKEPTWWIIIPQNIEIFKAAVETGNLKGEVVGGWKDDYDVNVDSEGLLDFVRNTPSQDLWIEVWPLLLRKLAPELSSPLHEAIMMDNHVNVRMLIEGGADVNITENDRPTPLQLAVIKGNAAIVELLINNNADVNAKTKNGSTPLLLASEHGNTSIVKLLINKGADVNATNDWGNTPLHSAVSHGRTKVVELLISKGANVNVENKWGSTSLHDAADSGYLLIVDQLIKKEADLNIKDKKGFTPLDHAVQEGREEVAELLRKHGALGVSIRRDDKEPAGLFD